MEEVNHAIAFAFAPDGSGGPIPLAARLDQMSAPAGGFVWVHVNAGTEDGRDWLGHAGLDPLTLAAMTVQETRPRTTVHDDHVLVYFRGVNLNPGAEPEDMVSLRLYLTAPLVVTVELRDLVAVDDVVAALNHGPGPNSPGDLVARLAFRIAERADPVVAALNERIDDLEGDEIDLGAVVSQRGELADIRRMAIMMRRYMFPQRDALSNLEIEQLPWLDTHARSRIREATERVTRLAEELDAIRDRAQVVHDMIMDMRSEAMNRQMLLLSVVSAIFLPLTFVTGLLGINVGGIPGARDPYGFWIIVAILLAMAGGLAWLFRRLGFLGGFSEK